ncbi:MAG: uL15 family ribosomal protein [Clostridia bacterium]|nr:uL15 family ribosomal protein [Clostridia bacterium]
MKTFIIIHNILSTIIALATLGCVIADVIMDYIKKKEAKQQVEVPTPKAEVTPEPEVVEEMPEIVDHIDAEEADEMISDNLAMSRTIKESGAGVGYKTYINLGTLDENFEANETITLDLMKEKGLVNKKAQRIKILADGILTKPFTIKAESFSIQAIKMIELTGGQVIILK